jgi:hypothetical protein
MLPQFATPDHLAWLLFLAGGLIVISGTAVSTPWVIYPGNRRFHYFTTQPARYLSTLIAFVISVVMWAMILWQYNLQQVLTGLAEFRSIDTTIGWALTIAVGIQALMPLMAFITSVRVLCTPPHFVRLEGGYVGQLD